jgi:hypothetical protein
MAGRIAYYGGIVTDGLALLIDAAKRDSYSGTGSFWRDLSGNGYNGTLENVPLFDTENRKSIIFDGINDNVNFGDVLDLGLNDMTISQWVRLTNNPSLQSSLSKSIYTVGNYRYALFFDSTPRVGFFISSGIDVWPYANTTLSLNTWYNITVTVARTSSVNIFINGIQDTLIGSATISQWSNSDFQSIYPYRIGSYTDGDGSTPNLNFAGNIATTYVYYRVLTDEEILRNFDSTKSRFGL